MCARKERLEEYRKEREDAVLAREAFFTSSSLCCPGLQVSQ